MRARAPFNRYDLDELDACFYSKAERVVALEDVLDGDRAANVLALRHDCDAAHSLATAVRMARWEEEHGYRSTYFVLHTAPYWDYSTFPDMLYEIANCGHEIGLHNDALAASLVTGQDPHSILSDALERLRGLGFTIRGSAGHGNRLCNYDAAEGEPWFANDEIFSECERENIGDVELGPHDRLLWRGDIQRRIDHRPMAEWGLEYEGLWLGHPYPFRFSDSGGRWVDPGWDEMTVKYAQTVTSSSAPQNNEDPRQLHILIHPDWWTEAFATEWITV